MTDAGILVVGHGSKLKFNKEAVTYFANSLTKKFSSIPVRAGFMNVNEPGISESIELLVSSGANTIFVVPSFVAHGIHTKKDITRLLGIPEGEKEAKVSIDGQDIVLRYCEPIGCDDRIAGILEDRVRDRM